MCKISVVTSVYNCEKFIGETIESVLNQTLSDWEFILIDDCSKDRSAEIIKSYAEQDSRIQYYRNEKNQGQCKNLNKGIQLSKGKYIARLDHDDICKPERFEKQFSYMEKHPEVVLLGSEMDHWENGRIYDISRNLSIKNVNEARFASLIISIMAHSSFFIRRDALEKNGITYDDSFLYAEDYAIETELLSVGEIFILPESLVTYRVFPDQWTQKYPLKFKKDEVIRIRLNLLSKTGILRRDIWEKAIRGELKTERDMKEFEEALIDYAVRCNVIRAAAQAVGNSCVQWIYQYVYDEQTINFQLLKAYARSNFRRKGWLFTRYGLSLIKKSLQNFIYGGHRND